MGIIFSFLDSKTSIEPAPTPLMMEVANRAEPINYENNSDDL
jgi:hypothetical protein